ncbi:MAG TPA: glycosyltransferase family 2 protein, partial [Novosphingobium sp.]|nr:glycosyltransferase family 2 protein [Novosphingobium sp.]
HAYQVWIATVERRAETLAGAPAKIETWAQRPRISVLVYQAADVRPAQFDRMIAALEAQVYRDWELVLVQSREAPPPRMADVPRQTLASRRTNNRARALETAIGEATGDYLLPLAADALLAPDALFHLARALQSTPDALLLYGDEDEIETGGRRRRHWFKPGWNRDLLLGQDYVSGACMIRADAARAALPLPTSLADAAAYALVLAATGEDGAQITRVPHVLCHRPSGTDAAAAHQAARIEAVTRAVAPEGATAQAGPHGSVRVAWPLPDPAPLVSVIIPSRDQGRFLRECVNGVLNRADYRHVEVLIIDNGSREAETLDYMARVARNPQVRVLHQDVPFNFSALSNYAVQESRGDYLCLLHSDIEIAEDGWLTAMMRQATRPGVGAVGARLLYPDLTIQHAGITVGLGDGAGHAHRFQHDATPGYFARAHVAHAVSAVTSACMLVEKRKYLGVGGFDARHFPVAFNDVDLCLKLAAAGWRNIYEPGAVMIHREWRSHGRDTAPAHIEQYQRARAMLQERWDTQRYRDPLHHPHFDRSSERYLLKL